MKLLARIGVGLLVILAVLAVVMVLWGGQVIKQSVNLVGPEVLGVPVNLEHARLSLLRGEVRLRGLVVGNPEGFNTESLFDMTNLEVDLNMRSLLSDTIIIERILVDRPQITYEVGLRRTNLGTLLEGLEGDPDDEVKEEQPAKEEKAPGKTVVIRELKIVDARAQVSATALGGRAVPIQLATITLNDLGGEDQSLTQITTQVLKAVMGAVVNGVAGAGDLLGDGLKAALGGVGAIGGAALDGTRAVVGVAGDGAQAVTGAVGSGLSRAGRLVGVGSQPDEAEDEAGDDAEDSEPVADEE